MAAALVHTRRHRDRSHAAIDVCSLSGDRYLGTPLSAATSVLAYAPTRGDARKLNSEIAGRR